MAALSDILIFVVPLFISVIIYLQMCRTRTTPRQNEPVNGDISPSKLSNLPIVTITANDILLNNEMKMDAGTRLALEMLSKHACIFIFIDVKDQEEADALLEPLKKEFEGIVDGDHILFSQTEMGRASMTRQLDSSAHFDFSTEVTHQASIFMNTILIAPDSVETTHFKWRGTNFKDFMTNGNTEFIKSLQK